MEQNIKNYLSQFKILTDVINIQDGYIINFGVKFDVAAHKYANKKEVKLKCIDKIKEYFHIDRMQFNQAIYKSQIMYELLGVDGVRGVNSVEVVQELDSRKLYNFTYDGASGQFSQTGTEGYGYYYDFYEATQDNSDVIIPSNPVGTPSVFELKNPNQDIEGVVK